MVTAFSAPWCSAAELQLTNRAVLWVFALDWQVDPLATSAAELDRLVRGQLQVADGATAVGRTIHWNGFSLFFTPTWRPRRRSTGMGGAWRAAARRTLLGHAAGVAVEDDDEATASNRGPPSPSI